MTETEIKDRMAAAIEAEVAHLRSQGFKGDVYAEAKNILGDCFWAIGMRWERIKAEPRVHPFRVDPNGDIRLSYKPNRQWEISDFLGIVEQLGVTATRLTAAWWELDKPFNVSDDVARVLMGTECRGALYGFSTVKIILMGPGRKRAQVEIVDAEGVVLTGMRPSEFIDDQARTSASRGECLIRIQDNVTIRVFGDDIVPNEWTTPELFPFSTVVPFFVDIVLPELV